MKKQVDEAEKKRTFLQSINYVPERVQVDDSFKVLIEYNQISLPQAISIFKEQA